MSVFQIEMMLSYLIVGLFGSAMVSNNPRFVFPAIDAALALFIALMVLGFTAAIICALTGIRI